MGRWFTQKEKSWISYQYNEQKLRPRDIQQLFEQTFGRVISKNAIQKYKGYSYDAEDFKNLPKKEIKPELEIAQKGNPAKGISKEYVDKKIKSLDDRLTARIESLYDHLEQMENGIDGFKITKNGTKDHIIDFSSGKISKEDLEKIAKIRGTDEKESFEFLKKCYKKGLFIINLETQEIDGVELEKEEKIDKDE